MATGWLRWSLAAVLLAGVATARAASSVSINGTDVPRATSTVDSTRDVVEFRSGGGDPIQLVPGAKRYQVCVVAPAPIAVLDAELPVDDTPSRFTVKIEDEREFARCLVASLKTDGAGGKRRLTYCLRCEDVTTPAP